MTWQPITKSEARGRGRPETMRMLRLMTILGRDLLDRAADGAPRTGTITDDMIVAAYKAVKEPWGGITLDITHGCIFAPTEGYGVATGAVRGGMFAADRRFCVFAEALVDAARKLPPGQMLGVFNNAETGTVDIDSVWVTDKLHRAECVAVAAHSVGGIYNFATGDGEWPPYLKGSN